MSFSSAFFSMLLQPSLSSPRDLLSCFLLYQSLISFSFLILSLYLYLYLSISPSLSTFLSLAFSFSLPLSISPLRPPSALPLPSLIASLLLVSTFISASCLLLSTSSSPRLLLHFFSCISHFPLPLSFPLSLLSFSLPLFYSFTHFFFAYAPEICHCLPNSFALLLCILYPFPALSPFLFFLYCCLPFPYPLLPSFSIAYRIRSSSSWHRLVSMPFSVNKLASKIDAGMLNFDTRCQQTN